jgi:hypothetical protein
LGGARDRHGLAVKCELLAGAERNGDAVQLVGVAETRGDEQPAIGQPVDERRAARAHVVLEALRERRLDRRDVVEHEVAAFFDGGVRRR